MGLAVSEVTTHGVGETEVSDEDLIAIARSWILRALASASSRGDKGHYNKLLSDLRDPRINDIASVSALSIRLTALSQTVSYFDEHDHQTLLMYLLGMSVWIYSEEVVDSLLSFVVNLATVNGSYVSQCLDMLVRNFLPPSCCLPAFLDSFSRSGLMMGFLSMDKLRTQALEHIVRKDAVLGCLHSALHQILELVPTAAFRLQRIVVQRMPHRTTEKQWLALYFESMLKLESSTLGGALGGQMLLAVVDRLIEIDVEIRWEDILKEEDSNKVFMFHMNLEDENNVDAKEAEDGVCLASDLSGPGIEAKHQHGLMVGRSAQDGVLPTLDEMADKMDLMMDMTFNHLQMCVNQGHCNLVFETLIRSFQTTILDTHKSKFTQFLIFYVCSLAPTTCGSSFALLLCDIFTSKMRPPNTRMSAAAYLASYLARASYLPPSVILDSVRSLLEWCVSYAQLAEDRKNLSMSTADPIMHGVFYSACQAVMYVLCFRLKELTDDPRQKRALRTLPLQELVEHHLNPLSVCLPSVVEEFVKQASLAQLVDCRVWADSKEFPGSQVMRSFGGDIRLDMFFPFDPYLLKQSDRFIRPNFIQWSMVEPPEILEDVHEEEDDFVNATFSEPSSSWEDDSSFSHKHMPHSPTSSVGSLDQDISDEDMDRDGEMPERSGSFNKQRGFEPRSFTSDEGGFNDHFLDHMSFSPPHELPRMPAKLPTVLHPSLYT